MSVTIEAPAPAAVRQDESRPLTGNEAIARGAWEAGVRVAAAYPGTPSTEILENLATYPREDLHAQWSTNEKVALDPLMVIGDDCEICVSSVQPAMPTELRSIAC